MGKVVEIGISKKKGDIISKVNFIEVIKNKGLINDRNFNDNSDKKKQVTLIEIENIHNYNKVSGTLIEPTNFRRNIITKGIVLNELLYKEFFIGEVKVIAHDLCEPCLYLQNLLKQKNLINKLVSKGGLRCEILTSGKIFVNDKILEKKND